MLKAEVRDDQAVAEVWAEIYPPSYQPPQNQEELVDENVLTTTLDAQGSDQYNVTYTGFIETGTYRIVFYAIDGAGQLSRLKEATVEVSGQRVYLPVILKK